MQKEPQTTLEKLEQIRALTISIRRMQEEYKAMQPTVPPIQLDGMPHGSSSGDAIPRFVSAREALADRITEDCKRLVELDCEVKPALADLPAHLFAFAMHYYYDARKVSEIAQANGMGESTLYGYKKELREELKRHG